MDIVSNFYYTGPLVWRTKLLKEDLKKIKTLASKSKIIDFRPHLAGHIQQEFEITNTSKLQSIIDKYLELHHTAFDHFYNHSLEYPGPLKIKTAWVNYMKKGEVNPIHTHTGCIFSSVMFLEIPKDMTKSIKEYKGTGFGPGHLNFSISNVSEWSMDNLFFYPEVGDFFVFPWNLKHFVTPFNCKGERVSLAMNFTNETGRTCYGIK
jgi:uncharacterized protein (TIGR02466 family)